MSVGRNATYNLAGVVVPLVLALATVPVYLSLIGPERYGVLALVWTLLGYFGLFDLGLGRAVMHRVASLNDPVQGDIAVASALKAGLVLGIVGAGVLVAAGDPIFGRWVRLSPGLRDEILSALPAIAAILPLAVVTAVLNGALMGRQRFAQANLMLIGTTSLFQLVPLVVAAAVGPHLSGLILGAFAARLVGVVMLSLAVRRGFAGSMLRAFEWGQLRALLSYGGWVTLTGIVGPLLVLSDRFVIGAVIGAVAVTIYTIPSDLANRLSAVPAALGNALFPRLATAQADEARLLTLNGVGALYAILTPPVVAGLFLMEPALVLWLGKEIGSQAAPIGRVLLIATWLNAFAQMPFARIQAGGRPDLIGKLHLAELPVYLVALWLAIGHGGLIGVSLVFLARVMIDTLIMFLLADRRVPHGVLLAVTLAMLLAVALALAGGGAAPGGVAALSLALIGGALALVPAWRVAPPVLRAMIVGYLRRRAAGAVETDPHRDTRDG